MRYSFKKILNEGYSRNFLAKRQILNILREEGYPTYAKLLNLFDVILTDDPEVIAYMIPGKAIIVVNENLDRKQISTIIRHEILHEWFAHQNRLEKLIQQDPTLAKMQQAANIAGDFDISNRGYTDKDKQIAKNIKLGDQILQGLVTELDKPGWENLSYEQMYRELMKDQKDIDKLKPPQMSDSQDIEDLIDQAIDQMNNQNQDSKQDSKQKPSKEKSKNNSDKDADADEQNKENQPGGTSEEDSKENKKKEQLQKIIDQLKDIQSDIEQDEQSDSIFDSEAERKEALERERRIEKIKDMLGNKEAKQKAYGEVEQHKDIERKEIAKKELEKYKRNPLNKFSLSLQDFIADQVETYRGYSWGRINKNYARSPIIKPGITSYKSNFVPVINVYWDVSGSFRNPEKTAGAERAIAKLNEYVKNKEIEINSYYFANRVGNDRNSVGGGTEGTPILEHIQETKPLNVIVITDSDIDDCRYDVTVPGAVWLLFYDSVSKNLEEHLHGRRITRSYLIK